jgi:hypothetical protein
MCNCARVLYRIDLHGWAVCHLRRVARAWDDESMGRTLGRGQDGRYGGSEGREPGRGRKKRRKEGQGGRKGREGK